MRVDSSNIDKRALRRLLKEQYGLRAAQRLKGKINGVEYVDSLHIIPASECDPEALYDFIGEAWKMSGDAEELVGVLFPWQHPMMEDEAV
jgi:hypothetical protein